MLVKYSREGVIQEIEDLPRWTASWLIIGIKSTSLAARTTNVGKLLTQLLRAPEGIRGTGLLSPKDERGGSVSCCGGRGCGGCLASDEADP